MKYLNFSLIIALSAGILCADVLRLRDGNRIQGTLLGANARELQFMPQGSSPKNFPITSVAGIDFATTPPPAPPPAPSAAGLVIPAGTLMNHQPTMRQAQEPTPGDVHAVSKQKRNTPNVSPPESRYAQPRQTHINQDADHAQCH